MHHCVRFASPASGERWRPLAAAAGRWTMPPQSVLLLWSCQSRLTIGPPSRQRIAHSGEEGARCRACASVPFVTPGVQAVVLSLEGVHLHTCAMFAMVHTGQLCAGRGNLLPVAPDHSTKKRTRPAILTLAVIVNSALLGFFFLG